MNADASTDGRTRLLMIDDDRKLCRLVSTYLEPLGFDLTCAHTGPDGVQRATAAGEKWHAIILDVMLPGLDGFEVLKKIRAASSVPVLMLTARGDETDRIVGLEVGAWDYLTKPFEPRELLARVRALLRRPATERGEAPRSGVTFAGWWLDVEQRRLRDPAGRVLALSEGEHALLAAFVARPGRVLTRDVLLDLARGIDAASYDRAIDIAVSRLRRKLAEADSAPLIETVRGVGYRFVPTVRPA